MSRKRCWCGGHVIKGKVFRWRWHPVCEFHYKWCCKHLVGNRGTPQTPYPSNQSAQKSEFNWGWAVAIALGVILFFKLAGGF